MQSTRLNPFPFIPNAGFALALWLTNDSDGRSLRALLPIPEQINRFTRLPDGKDGSVRFIPLEELLVEKIGFIFPGYTVVEDCAFRILRDSDLELEEEAEDLVREFEIALKRRRRGEVIHLSVAGGGQDRLKSLITDELKIEEEEIFALHGMVGLADLQELVLDSRPDLLWPQFSPRVPERVRDHEGDMLSAIRQKDMLLHHPYETFNMVVRFIRQAANDPDVVAIKQTLYRTSYDSPIVEALCEAAENGKSVTALVELKARFDRSRQHSAVAASGARRRPCRVRIPQSENARKGCRPWFAAKAIIWSPTPTMAPATITRSRPGYSPTSACSPATRRRDAMPRNCVNYVSGYARPASLEQLANRTDQSAGAAA